MCRKGTIPVLVFHWHTRHLEEYFQLIIGQKQPLILMDPQKLTVDPSPFLVGSSILPPKSIVLPRSRLVQISQNRLDQLNPKIKMGVSVQQIFVKLFMQFSLRVRVINAKVDQSQKWFLPPSPHHTEPCGWDWVWGRERRWSWEKQGNAGRQFETGQKYDRSLGGCSLGESHDPQRWCLSGLNSDLNSGLNSDLSCSDLRSAGLSFSGLEAGRLAILPWRGWRYSWLPQHR